MPNESALFYARSIHLSVGVQLCIAVLFWYNSFIFEPNYFMLQRIQSIWLFIAATAAIITLKYPFYTGLHGIQNEYHHLTGTNSLLLMILTIGMAVLAFITIFLFKDRIIQIRLCIAGILLHLMILFLYIRQLKNFSTGTFSITALLQIVILAALILAAFAINKDEKMVRDSNRLR